MQKPEIKPLLVYTTFGNAADAERVGRELVTARLAACVNIGAPMRSIYEWQGELEENPEIPVLIKSTMPRREALIARLVDLHPYDTPAVLVLSVDSPAAEFTAWLGTQTRA